MKNKILIISSLFVFSNVAHAQFYNPATNPAAAAVNLSVRQSLLGTGLSATSAEVIAAQSRVASYMAGSIVRIGAGAYAFAKTPTVLAIGGALVVGALLRSSTTSSDSTSNVPATPAVSIDMNPDGTVNTTKLLAPDTSTDYTSPAFAYGAAGYAGNDNNFYITLKNLVAAQVTYLNNTGGANTQLRNAAPYKLTDCSEDVGNIRCTITDSYGRVENQYNSRGSIGITANMPVQCPANSFVTYTTGWTCKTLVPPPPSGSGSATTKTETFESAISGLTDDEKSKKVSPESIAAIANAIGSQINQDPSYAGPPIPLVTSTDVTKATGGALPTIGQITQPISDPREVSYDPLNPPVPQTGTSTTPATGAGSTVQPGKSTSAPDATKVDLGIDPGISAPGLEASPTGASIVDAYSGMLPGFRTWQLPSHQSVCPTASFNIYGKTLVMDSHCYITEQLRSYIVPLAMAAWAVAAVMVVLKA